MSWTETPIAYASGDYCKQWHLTASADADDTYSFVHGLPLAPKCIILTGLGTAEADLATWKAASPVVQSVDAANVVIRKSTATGSGGVKFWVFCIPVVPVP